MNWPSYIFLKRKHRVGELDKGCRSNDHQVDVTPETIRSLGDRSKNKGSVDLRLERPKGFPEWLHKAKRLCDDSPKLGVQRKVGVDANASLAPVARIFQKHACVEQALNLPLGISASC
jgi:hypothetical protein